MILAVIAVVFSSSSDIDADSIIDQFDNCPDISNPTQSDIDTDRLGDECDIDDDNDGILDIDDQIPIPTTE